MSITLVSRRRFIRAISGFILSLWGLTSCKTPSKKEPGTSTELKKEPGTFVARLERLREGPNYFMVERVVIVKRGDLLSAMSLVCTHQECLLRPNDLEGGSESGLICPCHGSRFDAQGKVLTGPATVDLYHYPVSIDPEGNVLVNFSARL